MSLKNQVIVYAKPGCCLCDKVKEQLRHLEQQNDFSWEEVNILENPEAFTKFKENIPVVFVNGRQAFQHRLAEKEFLDLLL